MNEVLAKIQEIGIIPVVVLDRVEDALPLGKALIEGGLPCAEVTFRTAAAEESIRVMSENFPELLVGAGTVLTTEQVDRAVAAGAKFVVSPGLNPRIVKYCVEKGVIIVPGCAFTQNGYRLGYGGGYYDRYLPKTRAFTCGFFYEALKTEFLPEKTDIPLHAVITEEQIYHFI